MVNENQVNLVNKKPVELVQELKDYEIKKSPLSPAARAKVINKSGSNYVSENREGYGPCPDGCEQMLQTQIRDRDGNYVCTLYGAVRFFLTVDCLNWGGGGGYTKYITSTSEALDYAHELERGKYFNVSNEVELKCSILIRDAIRHYERGNKVYGHIKVQGNF